MKKRNLFITGAAMCAIGAMLLTGCGNQDASALADKGYLTLSVNPEIMIEYDKQGLVTDLSGKNDDGKKVTADYDDYIGKECEVVVSDLIERINEAGYFVDDIDGNSKNIVIQIEPGSVLPDDDFLDDVSTNAQTAVKNLQLASGVVSIDDDDYDDKYEKQGKPSHYITLEKAKEIALAQAGVKASAAVFDDKEFDLDDGSAVYELEFEANGNEYEYDVNAVTGKVMKAEHDIAGQNDDRDDDMDDADDRDDDRDDDWDDVDDNDDDDDRVVSGMQSVVVPVSDDDDDDDRDDDMDDVDDRDDDRDDDDRVVSGTQNVVVPVSDDDDDDDRDDDWDDDDDNDDNDDNDDDDSDDDDNDDDNDD